MDTSNVKQLMDRLIKLQDDMGDKFEELLNRSSSADKTDIDVRIEEINSIIDDTHKTFGEFGKYSQEVLEYQKVEGIPLGNVFEEALHGIELVKMGIEMVQLKQEVMEG